MKAIDLEDVSDSKSIKVDAYVPAKGVHNSSGIGSGGENRLLGQSGGDHIIIQTPPGDDAPSITANKTP